MKIRTEGMEEEEIFELLDAIEKESLDFFKDKVKAREENGNQVDVHAVFDRSMMEINNEKFDFVIGADFASDDNIASFTLVKKTKDGFEVIISRASHDSDKIEAEIKMASEIFNADVIRTKI
jgi:hypothetical protein